MYSNKEKIDEIRVFVKVNEHPGRQDIANALDMGEGIVRKILDSLKNKNLVVSTNKGHKYTNKGIKLINYIKKNIKFKKNIDVGLFKNKFNTAMLINDHNNKKVDYKIRDIAIRNQANGAMLFRYIKGKLELPDCDYTNKAFEKLKREFNFNDGSILVMTFADDQVVADKSCVAAVRELSKCLERL